MSIIVMTNDKSSHGIMDLEELNIPTSPFSDVGKSDQIALAIMDKSKTMLLCEAVIARPSFIGNKSNNSNSRVRRPTGNQ